MAELSLLSNITAHYKLHQNSNQNEHLTYWQFFWLHYSPFAPSHQQEHGHDLPLFNSVAVVVFTIQFFNIVFNNAALLKSNFLKTIFINNYQYLFTYKLMHPPKQ